MGYLFEREDDAINLRDFIRQRPMPRNRTEGEIAPLPDESAENTPTTIFRIDGGNSVSGYTARRLPFDSDVPDNEAEYETIYALQLTMMCPLPAGTVVIGHPGEIGLTGGNDP